MKISKDGRGSKNEEEEESKEKEKSAKKQEEAPYHPELKNLSFFKLKENIIEKIEKALDLKFESEDIMP